MSICSVSFLKRTIRKETTSHLPKKMDQKILLCSVLTLVFGLGSLVTSTTASNAEFKDVWSHELEESLATCRGRLPNSISGDELKWVNDHKIWYSKYSDQISLFRIINIFLAGHENAPLEKVRCLFESPCVTTTVEASFAEGFNVSYQGCTGGKIQVQKRIAPDGSIDTIFHHANGTAAFTAVYAPALTDSKSFILYISCGSDGTSGFHVYTTRAGLSAYTRHIIKDYLENSGFKDHFRVSTSFMSSTCKNRIAQ